MRVGFFSRRQAHTDRFVDQLSPVTATKSRDFCTFRERFYRTFPPACIDSLLFEPDCFANLHGNTTGANDEMVPQQIV